MATECDEITKLSAHEAISALHGEILGFYTNTRKKNYVDGIKGPDFVVVGLGKFSYITHLENKNPVESAIKKALGQFISLFKQGKDIGSKILYQQDFWSNVEKTSQIENLNKNSLIPQSPDNMLGIVDTYDVPDFEKSFIVESVL